MPASPRPTKKTQLLLVVMYTDTARAGPTQRQAAYLASAEKLLGPHDPHQHLPLFSVGTDLLLPSSANRDLRGSLGLSESREADWEIHLVSLGRGCREPDVDVPQAVASAAFLAGRSGAVFRGGGSEGGGVEEDLNVRTFEDDGDGDGEPWELVLRPRFGCQFFSEVRGGTGGREAGRIGYDRERKADRGSAV